MKLKQGHQCIYDAQRPPKFKHRMQSKIHHMGTHVHEMELDRPPPSPVAAAAQDHLQGPAACAWFPDLASTLPDYPANTTSVRSHVGNLGALNIIDMHPSGPEHSTALMYVIGSAQDN